MLSQTQILSELNIDVCIVYAYQSQKGNFVEMVGWVVEVEVEWMNSFPQKIKQNLMVSVKQSAGGFSGSLPTFIFMAQVWYGINYSLLCKVRQKANSFFRRDELYQKMSSFMEKEEKNGKFFDSLTLDTKGGTIFPLSSQCGPPSVLVFFLLLNRFDFLDADAIARIK